jgi:hypothetical protein
MEKNDAKSTTFIAIFRLKKWNFHYDFLFRKVLLKIFFFLIMQKIILQN